MLRILCFYCALLLELYLQAFHWPGNYLINYLQPPYREKVTAFTVGTRNQTRDNISIACQLHAKVRVHCLVQLTNKHELLKADHIQASWGSRCHRLHFIAEMQIGQAYRNVYEEYRSDLDWLLHVHVDSFVILENVRYVLAAFSPGNIVYFSSFHAAFAYAHVSSRDSTDYVLSRGALEHLRTRNCLSDILPNCLRVVKKNSSDLLFPFHVAPEVVPFTLRSQFWCWPYIYREVYSGQRFKQNVNYPMLFPYVTANQLHVLNFMLYHLRPYGHTSGMPMMSFPHIKVPAVPVDDTIARHLFKNVRIVCFVLTYPHKYEKVARSIKQTWGSRCNKLIIFSSRRQDIGKGLHSVGLNVSEGYAFLWGKTKAAFRHVYRHYLYEAEWFFKADDDTYVIMENMRYMLQSKSPNEPVYFGCNFIFKNNVTYMSGGAGYVLSREALRRLVEEGFRSARCNEKQAGAEDYEMGVCLASSGVIPGDSRDSLGRHRFLPLSLEHFMIPGRLAKDFWLFSFLQYKIKEGLDCCSTYVITIHYVVYYQMYLFDFLLYYRRPYGIITGHEPVNIESHSESSN